MRDGEQLTVHLLREMMKFDPHHDIPHASVLGALTAVLVTLINALQDEDMRARAAVAAMGNITMLVEADRAAMIEAATAIALSDCAGSV